MANPYTRQSSFSDGDTVTSALFNDEYDQLVLSFSSTVGHTHDGSTGEGAPITKLGPTQDVVIAAASILPKTNNVVDLGSSSLKFKDGYFAGNVTVDGVVTHSGNMTIGNAATDTLTINATIQGSALVFEGATANAHELTLAIPDVGSDVTITLPNATDTLVGKATTDVLTNKTLTSAVLNTGVSGTAVLDEDNFASDSATKLATQQSIKAYIATQVSTGDITSVVAGAGLTGGATSGAATVNVVGGTGITANADDIAIDSTVTTLTGSQALSNKTLTSPVINTGVSGTAVLDEDDFASDSATKLATQQSIKAYVATQVSTGDITSVVAGAGLTGGATSGAATVNVVGGTGITANADDIAIDSTVTTLTGSQTLTNKTLTAPILSGSSSAAGSILFKEDTDNGTNAVTLIGPASTADVTIVLPASADTLVGKATTDVLTNKTLTSPVLNTGVSGSAILDEDNLASDSATQLATQQSIKAYVDSEVSGGALSTEQVQDIVGAMVSGNTESGITVAYQDGDGTLDFTVGPVALTTVQTAANQSAQLALTTEEGDVVIRSDENKTYMRNAGTAGSMSDFTLMATPTDAVTSVVGQTGVVTTAQIKTALEDGIDSIHYVDASIDNEHLADDAVGIPELSATGTASNTTFLRGDNTWSVPIGGVTSVNSVTGAVTAAHIATAVEAASDSNTFTDADHTKLNAIAASANNYVHPNHSGEVTSTADGAQVIADNVVDEANLKISNAGSNGEFLSKQSGDTGGLTWASVTTDLVGDTTPQLGGFLDTNGNYIQTEKGADIASASPLVITTVGDYFDVTGTTNFAAMTVAADRQFTLQFDGVLTMTHHATNLDLPSEANITTAAGDVATFQSTGANTVQCINYTRADGTPLVGGATATLGFFEHTHTISSNLTISTNYNALSAGPITVASGYSVTVPSGSTWVIA